MLGKEGTDIGPVLTCPTQKPCLVFCPSLLPGPSSLSTVSPLSGQILVLLSISSPPESRPLKWDCPCGSRG